MLKLIRLLFLPLALLFIGATFTGAFFSDSISSSGNNFTAGTWPVSNVVINEFMADPTGADNAPQPGGEWVELFNKGTGAQDVAGWYLYDSNNTHKLEIDSSNVDGGSTVIAPGGYLVVNRNGDGDFELNNSTGDAVRLFDGNISSGNLVDSFSYVAGTIGENVTWARVPNGLGTWLDHRSPTRGAPNV